MRRILFPLLLVAGVAHAEIQTHGAEQFPGKIELSARIGYQAGIAGSGQFGGNPSGLKLFGEFAFKLTDLVWLDAQLNQVIGFGSSGTCIDNFGRPFPCGTAASGGWATELAVGVKLKIKTPIPLVVEIPIGGAIEFLYDRFCSDGGVAAPVFRFGGQVMYFLTKRIGVGGGFAFAFGPGFHGNPNGACNTFASYTDLFGSFDFGIGAEFIL